jgi:hypothetical protein
MFYDTQQAGCVVITLTLRSDGSDSGGNNMKYNKTYLGARGGKTYMKSMSCVLIFATLRTYVSLYIHILLK